MRAASAVVALNRGVVSRLGLARTDVKRIAMAAEVQTNFMPRVLGAAMLRVGWKYLGGIYTNYACRLLRFIFATDDTAVLEITANGSGFGLVSTMRIWINDVLLARPSVATAITNGTFAGNITGWTGSDEGSAVSSYAVHGGLGTMQFVGTGTSRAIREQQVTVAGGDANKEHGIRIIIGRGPIIVRVGSSSGADDYVTETALNAGSHSLSITPTGNFFIRFFSADIPPRWVSSVAIEAAGVVTIPTPWLPGDLGNLRYDQSGDVVFMACKRLQQMRIERRGTRPNARSWSLVIYTADDGPFNVLNVGPITLAPTDLTGNVTITASKPMFRSTHIGCLFSILSNGQDVKAVGAVSAVATPSIRVTGIGDDRAFSIIVSGDATGSTVTLQRSFDNASWANLSGTASGPWTADITTSFNDTLNNQIVFYRLILTTRVAPDSVTMELKVGTGSVRGIARVTDFNSDTSVNADVLSAMGGVATSTDWQEGMWSDKSGWPTAVRLHEGRLWWAGINGVWGSASDAYDSFDDTIVGDAGPINRTIGSGPVDTINWLLSLKGLLLGAQGAEFTARASSLDEPLTPTNFNVKSSSTQGSGAVESLKIDQSGYFVNRSGIKVFDLSFDLRSYDYVSSNLMELCPEIGKPGIVRMDVQRQPDTRIHCVRSDGTVVVGVTDKTEEVLAWIPVTTSGFVEDVLVLPALAGNLDDQVYYVVRRHINGADVRYLEKWGQESDCQGGSLNCQADAYITYSGAPATVITGLSHLEGQQVVVWADGDDVGTVTTARPWTQRYTVSGGQITLAVAASNVVVGLPYVAQFQSAKLGLVTDGTSPLNQQKKLHHLGVVLANTHRGGLKFGSSLDDTGSMLMDDMPQIESGTTIATPVPVDYDENRIEFPGTWTTDMRICLQAQAPRPCTVLAISFEEEQNT